MMQEIEEIPDVQGFTLITQLISILKKENWNCQSVERRAALLIEHYVGDKSDWGQYCPQHSSNTKTVLFACPDFSLSLIQFEPQSGNVIHDHGNSRCCFKVLEGELLEKQYKRPNKSNREPMQWHCKRLLETNDVNQNHTTKYIHCCRNLSSVDVAVSLVLYFPPVDVCHTYDEMTGRTQNTQPVADTPSNLTYMSYTGLTLLIVLLAMLLYTTVFWDRQPLHSNVFVVIALILLMTFWKYQYYHDLDVVRYGNLWVHRRPLFGHVSNDYDTI